MPLTKDNMPLTAEQKEFFRKGFLAGFAASGEGYNDDYGSTPEMVQADLEEALAELERE